MSSKARAYAQQARADFTAYTATGHSAAPHHPRRTLHPAAPLAEHHRLQLLQMAVEKLAKAFLYHAAPDALYSHNVVQKGINVMRQPALAQAGGMRLDTLSRHLRLGQPFWIGIAAVSPSIAPDGRSLTRSQSDLSQNVEYPWQADPADSLSWTAPATHDFAIVHTLRFDPNAAAAIRLLDRLTSAALDPNVLP